MQHCKSLAVLLTLGFSCSGVAQAHTGGGGGCHGDGLDAPYHHCGGDHAGSGDCSSAATTSLTGGGATGGDGLALTPLPSDDNSAAGAISTTPDDIASDGLDFPLHHCGGGGSGGDCSSAFGGGTDVQAGGLAELSFRFWR